MNKITEITGAGGVLAITVEGDGGCEKYLVAKEFFKPLTLSEGDAVGDGELKSLREATVLTAACRKALDALSHSDISRPALEDRLVIKYKFDRETAKAAADYAVRRGFLDEERQAQDIARRAVTSKNHGRRLVVAELISKGYPKDVAARAADSVTDEEYDAALRRALAKKTGESQKIIASLVRLGHSPSDAVSAVNNTENQSKDRE